MGKFNSLKQFMVQFTKKRIYDAKKKIKDEHKNKYEENKQHIKNHKDDEDNDSIY